MAQAPLIPVDPAKALGAYYTDARVAGFLVRWAIRTPGETVLDPSSGGGVFLRAACRRVSDLGGDPARQVFGAEIDAATHREVGSQLAGEFGILPANLLHADFFALDPEQLPVDAVVGNPPFIRYQRFDGAARDRALARAARQGVRLTELCSSWAPFLLHSTAMVKPGGRLAMVVPMELGHASYAQPVLAYLGRSFARLTLLAFDQRLFPEISQDTMLLLAEGRGEGPGQWYWRRLDGPEALARLAPAARPRLRGTQRISIDALVSGRQRLTEHFLPPKARELYGRLKAHASVVRLGQLADVGIGYVSGANEFFHLSPAQVEQWRLPRQFLRPAVCRGRALKGLRFTQDDWAAGLPGGDTALLLSIAPGARLPEEVQEYLRFGERQGVPNGYKCRSRSPWYRVPNVYHPDAFLTYMSGHTPRLLANDTDAVTRNTLHVVRLRPLLGLQGDDLAWLWQTSLTRLSAEVEGHALGGGMLKLEPTEAESVLVALPDARALAGAERVEDADALLRGGDTERVQASVDRAVLVETLGLTEKECRMLRDATRLLRARRLRTA